MLFLFSGAEGSIFNMEEENNEPKVIDENTVITMRSLFNVGNEITCLIGPRGCILRRLRQESGSKISITDGSCQDRIVTVTGSVDNVCTAYNFMCRSLEDFQINCQSMEMMDCAPQSLVMKLIVPATHCGSIIGKGGCKIKEIREMSGANVQVASEMLPMSTERILTVLGNPETISQAIYQICMVLIECTMQIVKGAVIPYEPKATNPGPIILSGGQAYTLHGEYAVPVQEVAGKKQSHPLAGLAVLGLEGVGVTSLTPGALLALSGSQLKPGTNEAVIDDFTEAEMTVADDIAGCVIGRGGSRLLEIRQISGAQINVNSGMEDSRKMIHIQGGQEAVQLAQYLINMCIELQKTNENSTDNPDPEELNAAISAFMTSSANTSLLEKQTPNPNTGAPTVTLGNLSELLASIESSNTKSSVITTGAYRKEVNE